MAEGRDFLEENLHLLGEVARLKKLIEFDRTGLAQALALVRGVVTSYGWLAEEGNWGSYEWHEKTEKAFRSEVARAFEEIDKLAVDALRASGRRVTSAFNPNLDTES